MGEEVNSGSLQNALGIDIYPKLHQPLVSGVAWDDINCSQTMYQITNVSDSPGKLLCPLYGCQFSCVMPSKLSRHVRSHKRPHNCTFSGCDYFARDRWALEVHQRTHTGWKPLKCSMVGCNYTASAPAALRTHEMSHRAVKPYTCTVNGCSYATTQISHLKRHARTHSGEKPFHCPEPTCSFRTGDRSVLSRHKKQHSAEKPFICEIVGCGFRTTRNSYLLSHQRKRHALNADAAVAIESLSSPSHDHSRTELPAMAVEGGEVSMDGGGGTKYTPVSGLALDETVYDDIRGERMDAGLHPSSNTTAASWFTSPSDEVFWGAVAAVAAAAEENCGVIGIPGEGGER